VNEAFWIITLRITNKLRLIVTISHCLLFSNKNFLCLLFEHYCDGKLGEKRHEWSSSFMGKQTHARWQFVVFIKLSKQFMNEETKSGMRKSLLEFKSNQLKIQIVENRLRGFFSD